MNKAGMEVGMRVVFMGTPDFAVATLEDIINAGHIVEAVVTQPDKPKGRGGAVAMSPVKETALEHGIEVLQPVKVKNDNEFYERMKQIDPDVIVVVGIDAAKTVVGKAIDINNIIVVITINILRFIIFLLYDLFNNV